MRKILSTAERVSKEDNIESSWLFKRSELAYSYATKVVSGRVLEVGCGDAYCVNDVLQVVGEYVLLDKFMSPNVRAVVDKKKVTFKQTTVPPLAGIESNSFDFVLCFQVIEHIKNDVLLLKEIHRVLKLGGKVLMTTPNKSMSLSRNPWHVREYLVEELKELFYSCGFAKTTCNGVFPNETATVYYEMNKTSVQKFRKWDVLGLEKKLPAPLFRFTYDILNAINRKKLASQGECTLGTNKFRVSDFSVKPVAEDCLDLYYIGQK